MTTRPHAARLKAGLLSLSLATGVVAAQPRPEESARPEGAGGAHATYLEGVLAAWPPAVDGPAAAGAVRLGCLATAGNERYVGMRQAVDIRAPLAVVVAVLDDIGHYKDLFPDTVDVRLLAGSPLQGRFVTAWVQRAPVFFLPDITYELAHRVDRHDPARVVYRYRLRRGDQLTSSDGIVVLEAIEGGITHFTEYDFFDARWGAVPTGVVWRESLRSAHHSDLAIKLRSEHPVWTYGEIASEATRATAARGAELDRCFADRRVVVVAP